MRSLILLAVLSLSPAVFAQNHPGALPPGRAVAPRGPSGPGNSFVPLNSGVATQFNPLVAPAPRPNVGFGGGFRGGFRGRGGVGAGTVIVPYPVYGGGYGGWYQPEPGQYDPIWGIYNPGPGDVAAGNYAGSQTPTVIINQNFQPDTIHPVLRDYSNANLPPPGPSADNGQAANQPAAGASNDDQIMYLIAMKDHTIYPALAYWVDKGSLNYITLNGAKNTVSLDLVDRDFSSKLNDERGVTFKLPMPK